MRRALATITLSNHTATGQSALLHSESGFRALSGFRSRPSQRESHQPLSRTNLEADVDGLQLVAVLRGLHGPVEGEDSPENFVTGSRVHPLPGVAGLVPDGGGGGAAEKKEASIGKGRQRKRATGAGGWTGGRMVRSERQATG